MKQLVIFDPDRTVTALLEDLVADRRARWDVAFVFDFEQAKCRIDQASCDLVVAAIDSGSSGEELLEHAKEVRPSALRFALAESHKIREMLRTMPVAHQSIPRPCSPTDLIGAIERGLGIVDLLGADQALHMLSGDDGLPVVPQVYTELMLKLHHPDTGVEDVVEIISRDVALCASILKIANSAYFGLAREIRSIREAVIYLGMRMIQEVVLSQEAFRLFKPKESADDPALAAIRTHAADVARVGKSLLTGPSADEMFLAGMMHEIGALMALSAPPDVWNAVRESRGDVLAQLSAFVLGMWGMPPTLVQAVAQHRTPGEDSLTAALHLADFYCAARTEETAWLGSREPSAVAMAQFGIESLQQLEKRLGLAAESKVA